MDMDIAAWSHIITITYFRYQNRPIQNRYHIIYHNSRILNMTSLNFEISVFKHGLEALILL